MQYRRGNKGGMIGVRISQIYNKQSSNKPSFIYICL